MIYFYFSRQYPNIAKIFFPFFFFLESINAYCKVEEKGKGIPIWEEIRIELNSLSIFQSKYWSE